MVISLFWIILSIIITLLVMITAYFLLYRRRINRALQEGGSPRPLAPPHRVLVLAALVLLAAAVVISYFVGYKTAYDRMENAGPAAWPETFYAEITGITGSPEAGTSVTVQGLAVNDARYRGAFSFAVYGETALERQGQPLDFSDLEIGDLVAVTFRGEPTSGEPAVLAHVVRVQLLE